MTNKDCYYTEAEFSTVLATFQQKTDFDPRRFRQSLERCAFLYREGRDLMSKVARPAERAEQLNRLGKRVKNLLDQLAEARDDPFTNNFLSKAARVEAVGLSPADLGFNGEAGDAAHLIQKITAQLHWLGKVIEQAKKGATAAKGSKGGNRPDVVLYEFVLSIAELYQAAAANPRQPTGWTADSETDEFLAVVQATLNPLGVKKSNEALRENYRDAMTWSGAGS